MSNKIRKLSIGADVKDQFHYVVGGVFKIPVSEGVFHHRPISHIIECEKHYQLHIGDGPVSQHWKDIPKNDITTPEYFID